MGREHRAELPKNHRGGCSEKSGALRQYEAITIGGAVLVLSIRELLIIVSAAAALGIKLVYRQVGGGSAENGRDSEGKPRYRFRVVEEKKTK